MLISKLNIQKEVVLAGLSVQVRYFLLQAGSLMTGLGTLFHTTQEKQAIALELVNSTVIACNRKPLQASHCDHPYY